MRLESALKRYPRVITPKKIIHFIWDFDSLGNIPVGMYPICKQFDYECISGSFNLPHDAITDWPITVEHIGKWRYCKRCLQKIKESKIV